MPVLLTASRKFSHVQVQAGLRKIGAQHEPGGVYVYYVSRGRARSRFVKVPFVK